jgi:hypothetical protein
MRVRLSDFTSAGTLTLSVSDLNAAVIDAPAGYAYFGGSSSIVQVRLSDFQAPNMLGLSISSIRSAVIAPLAGYAYFGADACGRISKVRLDQQLRRRRPARHAIGRPHAVVTHTVGPATTRSVRRAAAGISTP